jgi:hypothetical protein
MSIISKLIIGASLGVTLAACSPTANYPLLFGQTQTFGVGIHGSTTQGADLTLGYKDFNVAIVPVTTADGSPIRGDVLGAGNARGQDALSVLGEFNAETTAGVSPKVGLGKFFATGLAAQKLAEGYRDKLKKE